MRMDTLTAVFVLPGVKSASVSGKSNKISSEVDAIRLKGMHSTDDVESIFIRTFKTTSIDSKYKINNNPDNRQPLWKNLNYTDIARQSHKSLNVMTSVTIQNNNVESLPSIYFTRPTCGNTYTTKAPKRCGIFMTNGNKTVKISYTDL